VGRRTSAIIQTGSVSKSMSKVKKENRLEEFTPRQLLVNVYISQGIFLIIAWGLSFFLKISFPWKNNFPLDSIYILVSIATGIFIPILSIVLNKILPDRYFDDGGINEKIFGSLTYFHIAVLTGVIAFSEEWLFRGVIQNELGLFITSIIFSILHVRYVTKPLLFTFVILLSFWLGYLYEWTDTIWIPFLTHFLIDFISGCYIAAVNRNLEQNSENGE
jgi:membrane protease YdiL (CAAX protease family)